jgi:5'-AMP-activated protein kinase catalytic alpha subunit
MIAGKRYNGVDVDVWSSGITLYAMLCGYLPFDDPDTENLYRKIMNEEPQFPSFLSE